MRKYCRTAEPTPLRSTKSCDGSGPTIAKSKWTTIAAPAFFRFATWSSSRTKCSSAIPTWRHSSCALSKTPSSMPTNTGPTIAARLWRGSARNRKRNARCSAPIPWPYSVEKNQVVLETLLDYAFEQGLTERRLDIKEIFAPRHMGRMNT